MKKKIILIVGLLILALGIGTAAYVNDYYRAEEAAMLCISQPAESLIVSEQGGNYIFSPEDPVAGVIFYPGGKVQAESYAPLMESLAKEGILTILVPMPANLAVLDVNAAEGLMDDYPQVEDWYMAGHSLGGSMAASYIDKNAEAFEGLILLASYSTADLRDDDLDVLSLYGDQDQVLNKESYEEYRSNLPEDFSEEIIEGGCHAYFGAYGAQEGDGTPTISREEQLRRTVAAITEFIKKAA